MGSWVARPGRVVAAGAGIRQRRFQKSAALVESLVVAVVAVVPP